MSSSTPDEAAVWGVLASIPDPEFGINIVDLGLIYGVQSEDGIVRVTMTLTTPTCPSGGWIHEGIRRALWGLTGVRDVDVQVVFDPPWGPEMLSDEARHQLGR